MQETKFNFRNYNYTPIPFLQKVSLQILDNKVDQNLLIEAIKAYEKIDLQKKIELYKIGNNLKLIGLAQEKVEEQDREKINEELIQAHLEKDEDLKEKPIFQKVLRVQEPQENLDELTQKFAAESEKLAALKRALEQQTLDFQKMQNLDKDKASLHFIQEQIELLEENLKKYPITIEKILQDQAHLKHDFENIHNEELKQKAVRLYEAYIELIEKYEILRRQSFECLQMHKNLEQEQKFLIERVEEANKKLEEETKKLEQTRQMKREVQIIPIQNKELNQPETRVIKKIENTAGLIGWFKKILEIFSNIIAKIFQNRKPLHVKAKPLLLTL